MQAVFLFPKKSNLKGVMPMQTTKITKRVRTTQYIVNVHFAPAETESVRDKMLRIIKSDITPENLNRQNGG